MSKAEVTARRLLFVEAYVANGGNRREAAIAAGFKRGRAADKAAERLSHDVAVKEAIQKRRAEILAAVQKETGVSVAKTLRELHDLLHSDLRKCFDPVTGTLLLPNKWPDDVARAVASVKVVEMAGDIEVSKEGGTKQISLYTKEVKLWDKNAALEKAMKHLGLFEKENPSNPPMPAPIFNIIPVPGFCDQ